MIKVTDKTRCSGCTACYAVCPHHAVSMQPDALGFLYPRIDLSACTDCGLCEKVCAFSKPLSGYVTPEAKAMRNRDELSMMQSRSGAVFPVLADFVISQGGVVYGAALDEGFRVVHRRAVTIAETDAFRGSKYSQSDMNDMFESVRNDLKDGRHVLFSGTPCQVDGLRSFIPEKLQEKLLLVDIVCHGVPSPYVWRDYLAYQERRFGGKVDEVNFRDKKAYGWKAHKETFRFGSECFTDQSFTYLFYKHIMLRPSCSVCPYADLKRISDITLGDFWGWQRAVPGFNDDDKGVSLVLVNTTKAKKILDECMEKLDVRDVALADCLQPNLQHPSILHKDSDRFARDYARKGLEYVLKRYGDKGWRYQVYTSYMNIKRTVKGWLQK